MSFSKRVSFVIVCARIVRYALQNMWRNFGISLITISILTLSLVSVNALIAVNALTNSAVKAVEQQVDISMFFVPTAPQEKIDAVKSYVSQFPEVARIEYVDREQALAQFVERHKGNPEILKSLDVLGENPLGAILIVRTKDTKDYSKILKAVESQQQFTDIIQKRSFEDRGLIIDRVHTFTSRAKQFSLWLAALFAVISILIVYNAVRMAIYTQRDEISIKRLVGATNGFIRGPFFVEGLVYVLVSLGLVAGLLWFASGAIDPLLGRLFTEGGFSLRSMFFGDWWYYFGIECAGMLLLTWLTSLLAMRKYLKT